MIVAKVDRDYISESDYSFSRVGETFELTPAGVTELFTEEQLMADRGLENVKLRFRLLDDDEEVYYGGWLYNDNDCEVQLKVLLWGMQYAGCTIIEVNRDGNWKREVDG